MMSYSSMPTADLSEAIERLEDALCALELEEEPRRGWQQERDAVVARLHEARIEQDSRWYAEQYKLRLYRCEDFRPVQARNADEAAEIFANRWARREYGKRGFCYKARLDSWGEHGSFHTFECFVGVPEGNGCTGRNIWLAVRSDR